MSINLKIYGFNIRIINGYAPTDCGGTNNQKGLFYRTLKKACVKSEKHQKLLVVGDFNATTSIARYKSCYDGRIVLQDTDFNDNGSRLKTFCRSQKLCISSTFFEYSMIHRSTWYSNDKKTKKVNDYVLAESYIQ